MGDTPLSNITDLDPHTADIRALQKNHHTVHIAEFNGSYDVIVNACNKTTAQWNDISCVPLVVDAHQP